jgi:hypothetical protein
MELTNSLEAAKPKEDIRREYIFGTYCRSKQSDTDDMIVVKEHLHYPNGEIKNNLRFVQNYERKFYVTNKNYRDHEQKKEFEFIHKLDEYTCTQSQLVKKVGRVMGVWGARMLNDVNASPYVYGTDITTPVLLQNDYRQLWPDTSSDSTLAIMDYETDVVNGTELIISGSVTFKDKAVIAVTKDFLKNHYGGAEKAIREAMTKYLGEYEKSRNITLDVKIVNLPEEVVMTLFNYAHKWQPDFLGFWNMSFDIKRILEVLEYGNIPPESVFCDPRVPQEYKSFKWREDSLSKETADGKRISKHVADLWHSVTAPASFYCVDLMCLFKRLRVREKQRTSYSLDAILGEELDIGKLKFSQADGLVGLDWHYKMQTEYPIEYLIYNIFDCISVELLDEKTGDVSKGLRAAVDISEISKLSSNPKRLSDALYFRLKDQGKIIGSVSADMTEDLDASTPNKKGWIITLAAELQHGTGRRLINEYRLLETNIIVHAWDSDIASGYPTFGAILNVSKATSMFEVCGIVGLNDVQTRSVGINMSALKTNALEIAILTYDFPTPETLLTEFLKEAA